MSTINIELEEGLSVNIVATQDINRLQKELAATQYVEEQVEFDCEWKAAFLRTVLDLCDNDGVAKDMIKRVWCVMRSNYDMLMPDGTVSPDVITVLLPMLEPYEISINELQAEYAKVALQPTMGLGKRFWDSRPTTTTPTAGPTPGLHDTNTDTDTPCIPAPKRPRNTIQSTTLVTPSKPIKHELA